MGGGDEEEEQVEKRRERTDGWRVMEADWLGERKGEKCVRGKKRPPPSRVKSKDPPRGSINQITRTCR